MNEIIYYKSSVIQGNNTGTIINNFGEVDKSRNTLEIIVLAGKEDIYQNENEDEFPIQNYGLKPEDWKPYENENCISELVREFQEKSKLTVNLFFVDNVNLENKELRSKIRNQIAPKMVLILDIFAIHFKENLKFAKLFDHNQIGGFLTPLCSSLSEEQKKFARKLYEEFEDIGIFWEKTFNRQYMFIDLDIPNKFLLFRRLADIAFMHLKLEESGKLDEELQGIVQKAPKNLEDL
jgi:hypothetical protein